MTFRTPEEAVERANNTPYGLSAGVWTDKGSKIFKIVNKLRAGVVWANTSTNSTRPVRSAATRKAVSAAKAACRVWRHIAGWIESTQLSAKSEVAVGSARAARTVFRTLAENFEFTG